MDNCIPFKIAGCLFLLVGLAQIIRAFIGFPIIVGSVEVPKMLSLVIGLFLLGLSIWILKSIKCIKK